ncbi:hypothetical protein GALL_482800 [mine drainage metagenome]|uniref:Uncharacterized protein n=1 Tax=mine drainage metagenome TaxID=410659 RepID=A0A1J5PH62_9ZZZZ
MKVQTVRRIVIAQLPKDAPKGGWKGLDKVVRLNDFVQSGMYCNQKLPEKGTDFAAYPFAAKSGLEVAEKKIVALVRPGVQTPYDDVANQVDVQPEQRPAQLPFVLREISEEAAPPELR